MEAEPPFQKNFVRVSEEDRKNHGHVYLAYAIHASGSTGRLKGAMTNMNQISRRLKEMFISRFDLPFTKGEIEDTTSIFNSGLGLDSMSGMELIVALEESFGISISEEDIVWEVFETFGTLKQYVGRILSQADEA